MQQVLQEELEQWVPQELEAPQERQVQQAPLARRGPQEPLAQEGQLE